jgi:outer membrane protein TolC
MRNTIMRNRPAIALLALALWGTLAISASAQEWRAAQSPPHVLVNASKAELEAPISPAESPGPMSLDACIDLGFQHQPALDAARASLAASQSGKRAVDRMILPGIFAKDLPIRRKQACQGVAIAEAGLTQAEWDTRYAITRNFFTVQYIRSQQIVVDDVLQSLEKGHARAKRLFDAGDPTYKITQIDLNAIKVQIALVKGRKSQAKNGMLKAEAALREAMGLGYDYPLEIAAVDLPAAVYEVKTKKGKEVEIAYYPLYQFNKSELIAAAIANRGEMTQASAASVVVNLEIEAQGKIRGWQGRTFAQGADLHVQPVPLGRSNGDYAPGAFAPEMPVMLAGRKRDREQRARDLAVRARAVVDKAQNLVALDVEAQFLKWQEAVEDIQGLREIYDTAQKLPEQVKQLVQDKDLTSGAIIQASTTAISVRAQLNDEMHIHALALAGLERATAGAFRVYPIPASPR